MKLGELRALIRKTKGNVYIWQWPFPGTDLAFRFAVQKTPLLEELERVYPGGKATETGLSFNVDTGELASPAATDHAVAKLGFRRTDEPHPASSVPNLNDDLDLDLDDAVAEVEDLLV